jgi:hypothetical protein
MLGSPARALRGDGLRISAARELVERREAAQDDREEKHEAKNPPPFSSRAPINSVGEPSDANAVVVR